MSTPEVTDVKAALTAGLTELRLPTVRHCYEETARLAERETLSYERYLLQLVARECEARLARADSPRPEQAKTSAVPSDDGLRFDDDQGRFPITPHTP